MCSNRAVALSHPRHNFLAPVTLSLSQVNLHQGALRCHLNFYPAWPALHSIIHFQGPADFLVHVPQQENFPGNQGTVQHLHVLTG